MEIKENLELLSEKKEKQIKDIADKILRQINFCKNKFRNKKDYKRLISLKKYEKEFREIRENFLKVVNNKESYDENTQYREFTFFCYYTLKFYKMIDGIYYILKDE